MEGVFSVIMTTFIIKTKTGHDILIDGQDKELDEQRWSITKCKYAYTRHPTGPGTCLMHRIIINAQKGEIVDHINGNPLDNRRCNLRLCTQSQNLMNMRKTRGKSQYKGVYLAGSKQPGIWKAGIKVAGKIIYLGRFTCEHEAGAAYNRAAQKHYGEFANLNDIKPSSAIDVGGAGMVQQNLAM